MSRLAAPSCACPSRDRGWVCVVFGALLLILVTARLPATAGTIHPELQAIMSEPSGHLRIPVIIRLQSQADVGAAASGTQTRTECVQAVIAALEQHAAATQNAPTVGRPLGLLEELQQFEGVGVRHVQSFYIDNAVAVDAIPEVIADCADRADVDTVIYAGRTPSPAVRADTALPQWNVSRVRAPEVWDLGIRGAGALVAAIDTGANAAHPALEATLLRDPAGLPIWLDAVRGRPTPYDDSGHGSHVLGIAVGADGIGVAPDANWIACKAFTRGPRGTIRAKNRNHILTCAQWVLNPDAPGPPDPAHIPDVVVNAWWVEGAAGACVPLFQNVVRAWRACGILPVFAVGNDPTGVAPADAVPSPANYPEAFSVGATNAIDEPVASSFHGTAACGGPGRPAPRLLAPGINITSAARRGLSLEIRSGTDVAAPHVAGAAALLRSASPDLSVDRIDEVLERSAQGFMPGPPHRPGLLDALAAVTFEDARFVNQQPPVGTQLTGDQVGVTVVMRNSGVTTWQRGVHRLAPVPNSPTWGISRVDFPTSVSEVRPGDPPVAFTFNVTVPQVPNLSPGYRFQWQMVHEARDSSASRQRS